MKEKKAPDGVGYYTVGKYTIVLKTAGCNDEQRSTVWDEKLACCHCRLAYIQAILGNTSGERIYCVKEMKKALDYDITFCVGSVIEYLGSEESIIRGKGGIIYYKTQKAAWMAAHNVPPEKNYSGCWSSIDEDGIVIKQTVYKNGKPQSEVYFPSLVPFTMKCE